MDFLFSNIPPVKTIHNNFKSKFLNLMGSSDSLALAVGYVSADSMLELRKIIEQSDRKLNLELIIGMHYFDGFTKNQFRAAQILNDFLNENMLGTIRLVNAFRYHGKVYTFSDTSGAYAGIIGSNNLSSLEDMNNTYEASVFIDEKGKAIELHEFIKQLSDSACVNLDKFPADRIIEENPALEGQIGVMKLNPEYISILKNELTATTFEIPLKTEEKSNLNAYHGKGRADKRGLVKPRHWYEVELIVPSVITRQKGYPQKDTASAVFTVITDDGYSFKCKVSGDYSKNLRSENDLRILGKWIKGRLEANGALIIGDKVTESTFSAYGRNNFTMTKTNENNIWFLDFGVN